MFTTKQIFTATTLMKNFSKISEQLREHPQACLITQKSGDFLVLVSAEIFENLMEQVFAIDESTAPVQGDCRTYDTL